jgi:hypothetical protein
MSNMTVPQLIDAIKRMQPEPINYNDTAAVTLQDNAVNVVVKPSPESGLVSVNLAGRLAEILGLSVQPDYQPFTLDYSYQSGSETVRYGRHNNVFFSGRYHPTVVCEGRGVCMWCGVVL